MSEDRGVGDPCEPANHHIRLDPVTVVYEPLLHGDPMSYRNCHVTVVTRRGRRPRISNPSMKSGIGITVIISYAYGRC